MARHRIVAIATPRLDGLPTSPPHGRLLINVSITPASVSRVVRGAGSLALSSHQAIKPSSHNHTPLHHDARVVQRPREGGSALHRLYVSGYMSVIWSKSWPSSILAMRRVLGE